VQRGRQLKEEVHGRNMMMRMRTMTMRYKQTPLRSTSGALDPVLQGRQATKLRAGQLLASRSQNVQIVRKDITSCKTTLETMRKNMNQMAAGEFLYRGGAHVSSLTSQMNLNVYRYCCGARSSNGRIAVALIFLQKQLHR